MDELKELVVDFKDTMPIVIALRNNNLESYHFDEIKAVIGKEFEIDDKFTLRDLMNLNVINVQKEIIEISTQVLIKYIFNFINYKNILFLNL